MQFLYLFKFVIPLFPHWALSSSHSLLFNPLQVCARPHTNTWWIRRTFQIFKLGSIWYPNIHWIVSSLCYDFDYPYLFWWSVYLFISMLCKVYVFLIRFVMPRPEKVDMWQPLRALEWDLVSQASSKVSQSIWYPNSFRN